MTIKEKNILRITQIFLEIIFIVFLLMSGWTELNLKIYTFNEFLNIPEIGRIISIVPPLITLQMQFINKEKSAPAVLIVFVFYFLLELMTAVSLFFDEFSGGINIPFNFFVKTAEFVVLLLILILQIFTKKDITVNENINR